LGVLLAGENLDEAIVWSRKANELRPHQPKYAFTVAFYLRQNNEVNEAIEILNGLILQQPRYMDTYMLLGEIYETTASDKAEALYRQVLSQEELSAKNRYYFEARLNNIHKNINVIDKGGKRP